jgi:hypothetical protein
VTTHLEMAVADTANRLSMIMFCYRRQVVPVDAYFYNRRGFEKVSKSLRERYVMLEGFLTLQQDYARIAGRSSKC